MKIIGLDVGTKRIGVAKADTDTRIAIPDGIVLVNGQEFAEIARLGRLYDTNLFVIGLPRNSLGEETAQSTYVRNFAHRLARTIKDCKIYFQDESLTSVEAENRLKARKKHYQKGEIDAEAAAIILQDCLEHLAKTKPDPAKSPKPSTSPDSSEPNVKKIKQEPTVSAHSQTPKNKSSFSNRLKFILLFLVVLLSVSGFLAYSWYDSMLQPPQSANCRYPDIESAIKAMENSDSKQKSPIETDPNCLFSSFKVEPNQSLSSIASKLEAQKLIKNSLAFEIRVRLSGNSTSLKTGEYQLRPTMSVAEIVDQLVSGSNSGNVFNFTILPGETLASIKKKLQHHGYAASDIEQAFSKHYDHPLLEGLYAKDGTIANSNQPASVQLEGYLYGETYQFYKGESLENIIQRVLDQFWQVVQAKKIIPALKAQNLTLREGIILASIVQKEAKPADQPGVASVFLNRLRTGMMLGSDITATYAANLLDPKRETYKTNAEILSINNFYNTRVNAGLTPGPISVPSISALMAVAHPAEISYRFFLTGDNGKMYYGYTDAEHQENIRKHCHKLCQSPL